MAVVVSAAAEMAAEVKEEVMGAAKAAVTAEARAVEAMATEEGARVMEEVVMVVAVEEVMMVAGAKVMEEEAMAKGVAGTEAADWAREGMVEMMGETAQMVAVAVVVASSWLLPTGGAEATRSFPMDPCRLAAALASSQCSVR